MLAAMRLVRYFSVEISKENVYLEYVSDIRKLDTYSIDSILHKTYVNSLTSLNAFTFDQYKQLSLDSKKHSAKFLIIKERKFDTILGFCFYPVHELFYLENNFSNENRYLIPLFYNINVVPHFRKYNLGHTAYRASEILMKKEFPNSNRITFNLTLNSGLYQLRSNITPLIYPGPRKMPSDEVSKLWKKSMKDLGHVPLSDEHPFIKFIPGARIVGMNREKYLKNIDNVSEETRFFYETTQLRDEWCLMNLAIYNLIENNTLGLEAKEYASFGSIKYDIIEYGTNKKIEIVDSY